MTPTNIPPCPKCGVVPEHHGSIFCVVVPQCKCLSSVNECTIDAWTKMCAEELRRALRDLGIETVAQVRELKETREAAVEVIANWVDAIDRNGGGWDGWDQHYKNAKYGNTPIRALVDEALRRRAAEGEK